MAVTYVITVPCGECGHAHRLSAETVVVVVGAISGMRWRCPTARLDVWLPLDADTATHFAKEKGARLQHVAAPRTEDRGGERPIDKREALDAHVNIDGWLRVQLRRDV